MRRFSTTYALAFIFCIPVKEKLDLTGAWKVMEVQTVQANGRTTSVTPTESQLLFAHGCYSFFWTTRSFPSTGWSMPDSVKLSRVNNSLLNGGTYEVDGNKVTMHADFALNPKFVGGVATYTARFSGDTLVLTGTSVIAADGQSNPAYQQGSHFVTRLLPIHP